MCKRVSICECARRRMDTTACTSIRQSDSYIETVQRTRIQVQVRVHVQVHVHTHLYV